MPISLERVTKPFQLPKLSSQECQPYQSILRFYQWLFIFLKPRKLINYTHPAVRWALSDAGAIKIEKSASDVELHRPCVSIHSKFEGGKERKRYLTSVCCCCQFLSITPRLLFMERCRCWRRPVNYSTAMRQVSRTVENGPNGELTRNVRRESSQKLFNSSNASVLRNYHSSVVRCRRAHRCRHVWHGKQKWHEVWHLTVLIRLTEETWVRQNLIIVRNYSVSLDLRKLGAIVLVIYFVAKNK